MPSPRCSRRQASEPVHVSTRAPVAHDTTSGPSHTLMSADPHRGELASAVLASPVLASPVLASPAAMVPPSAGVCASARGPPSSWITTQTPSSRAVPGPQRAPSQPDPRHKARATTLHAVYRASTAPGIFHVVVKTVLLPGTTVAGQARTFIRDPSAGGRAEHGRRPIRRRMEPRSPTPSWGRSSHGREARREPVQGADWERKRRLDERDTADRSPRSERRVAALPGVTSRSSGHAADAGDSSNGRTRGCPWRHGAFLPRAGRSARARGRRADADRGARAPPRRAEHRRPETARRTPPSRRMGLSRGSTSRSSPTGAARGPRPGYGRRPWVTVC